VWSAIVAEGAVRQGVSRYAVDDWMRTCELRVGSQLRVIVTGASEAPDYTPYEARAKLSFCQVEDDQG